MSTRYSDDDVSRLRIRALDARRVVYWAIPVALAMLLYLLPVPNDVRIPALLVLLCGAGFGIAIYLRPQFALGHYDPALTAWLDLVKRSDPAIPIAVHFPLLPGEVVHYSEKGQRFEERRTGQLINTESRTKNAVGSAVVGGLLFGPAGAVVGGGMARRHTTGMATDVYDVVSVDDGAVAFTSDRSVFMGVRDTIEVPLGKILDLTSIEATNRIIVEYPARAPGESYSVNTDLFTMCMARRAKRPGFAVALPPPPVAMNHAVQ